MTVRPNPIDLSTSERAELDAYLKRLRRALRPLPAEERDEILRETESHFLDQLESGPPHPSGAAKTVAEIAAALGSPEEYGQRFVEDYRITTALASGSTVEMLRTTALFLGQGVKIFVGFHFFLTLFALMIGFGAVAVLKLVFPENVGMWFSTDPGVFRLGFSDDPEPYLEELLGYWIVPLGLGVALLIYRVTGTLLRRFLSSLRRPL